MAPDSQTETASNSGAPDSGSATVFTAASDSMQNLLAEYFSRLASQENSSAPASGETVRNAADNVVELKPAHFDVRADNALSSPQTQTRAIEAFTALLKHVSAATNEKATEKTVAPATQEKAWPESARTLVKSLRKEISQLREQLQLAREEAASAHKMADHDVLTPTLNRRAFLREVHRTMADCRRYNENACILFLDMDHFKDINDTYGHAAGDAALIHTARLIQASIREGDSVGRMGGDEFAVLLRRADLNAARAKAARLEQDLKSVPFEYDGLFLNTSGSFGVRAYAGQPSAEVWLSEADAAMFLVKKASR